MTSDKILTLSVIIPADILMIIRNKLEKILNLAV
jgi:hypothetical protein